MPRIKKLHTCPNQSIHKQLISIIQSAGYSTENLRSFLWKINAHDRLIAFPKISQNVLKILEVAEANWCVSVEDFQLHGVKPILKWIIDNSSELTIQLGEEFNRQPQSEKDHPIMHRGSSRHPLYTTLWNTCESRENSERYLLLQAHLLFAHCNALFENNNQSEYENYSGQSEWKGLDNSPYTAALAVRDFSLKMHSDLLVQLQVYQHPTEFAKSINNTIEIDQRDMLIRIQALERFLQKSIGIRNWVTHQTSGANGRGGSEAVTGYVEFSDRGVVREILIGDKEDPDSYLVEQTQLSELVLNQHEIKEMLDLDLCPYEFESQELILSNVTDSNSYSGDVASFTASQMRHVVMANQLFPWNFNILTIQEVANALAITNDLVIKIFNSGNQTEDDLNKLEVICLMRIMLFTASSFDRARQTICLEKVQQNIDAPLAFIETSDKGPLWRVRAIQPAYKRHREAGDNSEKMRSDYFFLEERAFTNAYIALLIKLRNSLDGVLAGSTRRSYPLFRKQPETLLKNLKNLFTEIDPSGRITINKLSKFLFNHLLNETNGDICVASLIAGDEHLLAHVRLFYSVTPINKLQQIYVETVKKVVSQLHLASNKQLTFKVYPDSLNQVKFVGSRLCPTTDSVKKAIRKLQSDILVAFKSRDSFLHHNLYTLLTTWRFAFATACRAINTPYVSLSEIDVETGIGVMSDKDDGTGYKSRIIWLPDCIRNEMKSYESHRMSLKCFSKDEILKMPPIFFIEHGAKNKAKTIQVSPKTMMPMMEQYLPYPANFHRRFMRSELLESGCPIEVVDCWMGHWHAGEEPWATHSAFSYQLYQLDLQKFMVPILYQIGLVTNHELSYNA